MTCDFQLNPIVIALCVGILAYFLWQGLYHCPYYHQRKWLWLGTRLLILLCLTLVLMDFQLILTSSKTATIFLVDRSFSVEQHKGEMESFINRQIAAKEARDQIAVLTFGREPMIEQPLTQESKEIKLMTQPHQGSTNLQKALEFAVSYFPPKTNRRLVLISDGQENVGSLAGVDNLLQENKVNLLFFPLETRKKQDVQLTALRFPYNIHKGETIPVTAEIDSNISGEGSLYLYLEDQEILTKKLHIKKGFNKFTYFVPCKTEGNSNLRGEIIFPPDENLENNKYTAPLMIRGIPKVLIIGDQHDTANIDQMVDALGYIRTNLKPREIVGSLDFLLGFEEIILVNTSHEDLTEEFEHNLTFCVEQQGTGLLVVGGENTFALGGYKDTTLEKMLPVTCKMRGDKKQPNTGLVLIIDCSGSMAEESNGVQKIEMAKEAALRSLEILEPHDYLGIVAFSDRVEGVVPFQQVQDKDQLRKKIGTLSPQGGTLIIPALHKAKEFLQNANIKTKHIILLSDGQGEKSGYQKLVESFKKQEITVSTVALGKDADNELLQALGQGTQGRNYLVHDCTKVPGIFTKETYLSTKKYLNNREFVPQWVHEASWLPAQSPPVLKGYMGTGIKQQAEMLLKSDKDDPILATWQYGLGKVVVWTSDLNGKWSKEWIKWPGLMGIWKGAVNYCLPHLQKDMNVEINKQGNTVALFVDTGMKDTGQMLQVLVKSSHSQEKIKLSQVSAGKFSGHLELNEVGEYALSFVLQQDQQVLKHTSRVVYLDYSPEYALTNGESRDNLQSIAGTCWSNDSEDVFASPLKIKNKGMREVKHILLPLALGLLIADIGIRKW